MRSSTDYRTVPIEWMNREGFNVGRVLSGLRYQEVSVLVLRFGVMAVTGVGQVAEQIDDDEGRKVESRAGLEVERGVGGGRSRRVGQQADQSAFLMACSDEQLLAGFRPDPTIGAV